MKVLQCISAVAKKLAVEGISKSRKNEMQKYFFRGIDDVYNAMAPLLAEVGLVIVPSYAERTVLERETKSGGALFYVTVTGNYKLFAAEDGSYIDAGPFFGEAMDSADKATNKAMSAAYKYMAMQVFSIPTEGDNDADATTHDVKSKQITPAGGVLESLPEDERMACQLTASIVIDMFLREGVEKATDLWENKCKPLGADAKVAAWNLMPSNVRNPIKALQKKRSEEVTA